MVRGLPKSDPARSLYCVFSNLLLMLEARGYDISEYNDYVDPDMSDRERFELFKSDGVDVPFETVFNLRPRVKGRPDNLNLYIHSVLSHGMKVRKIIETYHRSKTRREPLNILVVYDTPKDLDVEDVITLGSLEVMCYQQLLVDPILHVRAPIGMQKLSPGERNKLIAQLDGKELVRLRRTDPIALALNASPGDVIKYKDARLYTGQSITTVEYKMVD